MKTKFKIYRQMYFNSCGTATDTNYIIKKKHSFLGIPYWTTIKRTCTGYGDEWKELIEFKSEDEAKDFIKYVLCAKVPRQKWISTIVSEHSCNQ